MNAGIAKSRRGRGNGLGNTFGIPTMQCTPRSLVQAMTSTVFWDFSGLCFAAGGFRPAEEKHQDYYRKPGGKPCRDIPVARF